MKIAPPLLIRRNASGKIVEVESLEVVRVRGIWSDTQLAKNIVNARRGGYLA
ncbi:MAG: hypothetical protein V4696_07565 [Pseudomonadota bacterium]